MFREAVFLTARIRSQLKCPSPADWVHWYRHAAPDSNEDESTDTPQHRNLKNQVRTVAALGEEGWP